MDMLRFASIISIALATSGCFQSTTLIRVNADGSGTLEQTTLVTQAALRSLRQIWAMSNDNGTRPADLFSTAQARQFAEAMGSGVTLVSSAPIKNAEGEGSRAVFAFRDISQLQPKATGTAGAETFAPAGVDVPQVHFAVTRSPNGHALLRITMPPSKVPPASTATAPEGSGARPQTRLPPEQLAMVKQLFAGMRIAVAIEPAGQLVKTSCPFVDGNRVTLVDVAFDQLLANDTAFVRLQSARSVEDVRAAMKQVPGLRVNLDPETTIEFVPNIAARP
jgi:hypothetical protein